MLQIRLTDSAAWSAIEKKDFAVVLIIAAVMVACQFLQQDFGDRLALRSDALAKGEIWRLFSPYFIHANWAHLAMNLASLVAVLSLFPEMLRRKRLLAAMVLNALVISVVISFFLAEGAHYYGFSALLYGFMATSAIYLININPFVFWVLGFLVVKISWEQLYGPLQSSVELVGGHIATDSHLIGVLVGTVFGLLGYSLRAKNRH